MSEPFMGEIRMFGFNFAPRGWAKCEGQLLPISSNTALFSLLGTTFGGDGRTTFGLPDLRGRAAIGDGSGPGLTPRSWGAKGGQETVTLTAQQIPSHTHQLHAAAEAANESKPGGNELASGTFYHAAATDAPMAASSIGNTGGSQSHTNMQPWLAMNYCIATTGIYPSRN